MLALISLESQDYDLRLVADAESCRRTTGVARQLRHTRHHRDPVHPRIFMLLKASDAILLTFTPARVLDRF